jgi:hypothetical protein
MSTEYPDVFAWGKFVVITAVLAARREWAHPEHDLE